MLASLRARREKPPASETMESKSAPREDEGSREKLNEMLEVPCNATGEVRGPGSALRGIAVLRWIFDP
jgi:hypothetical protein